jgi:hypothetical protein
METCVPVPSPPQMRTRKPLAFSMSGINMLSPTAGPPIVDDDHGERKGRVSVCAW